MTKPDNCFTCPKPECRPISECPMCKIAGCDAIRCGNDTVCKIITPENCFNHCPIAECVKLSQLGDDCGNYSDVKKICDTGLTCKLTDISLPEIGGVCVKEAPSCAAVTCLSGSVCEITQKTCVSCPEARCSLPKECVACDMMIPTCDAVDCAEGYQCSVVPPKDCTECAIAQCVPTF
ncbi:hypothetical protein HK099_005717 [Clydaea vesicula]|uniref:Uncharacterized protein n=1 Tax=Clydaea vesicula TaxID=447962 RepID=A0AAD5U7N8_9FUNG|nr:hypothetical protein HK099_005717 [Clydaea vesicula]